MIKNYKFIIDGKLYECNARNIFNLASKFRKAFPKYKNLTLSQLKVKKIIL